VVPVSRHNGGTWHRVGFPRGPQAILSPRPNFTGNLRCPRCYQNHVCNCVNGK